MDIYASMLLRQFNVQSIDIVLDSAKVHPTVITKRPRISQQVTSRRQLLCRWGSTPRLVREASFSHGSTTRDDDLPSRPSRSSPQPHINTVVKKEDHTPMRPPQRSPSASDPNAIRVSMQSLTISTDKCRQLPTARTTIRMLDVGEARRVPQTLVAKAS